MWCVKFVATFVTVAKRDAAVTLMESRLAPVTGSFDPADREIKYTDPAAPDLVISFIYNDAPIHTALQTLWNDRPNIFDTRATGGRAGLVTGWLVIVEYDNTSQPLVIRWMCVREDATALIDCRDDDVPATQNDAKRTKYYPGSK